MCQLTTTKEKTLNEVVVEALEVLSEIPYINNGGCGFAAYSIYLYLKKHNMLPEDFSIVYLNDDWDNEQYFYNQGFLTGNNPNATSCAHAVVFMEGRFIDSFGPYDPDYEDYGYRLFLTPDVIDAFMTDSLSCRQDWNSLFKRDEYVPLIEKELGIKFNLD